MNWPRTVFVIGGGVGTEHQNMHTAVDEYMAWGTAEILPVAGTGGVAQRIIDINAGYGCPILDSPLATEEKARKLVASIDQWNRRFSVRDYWGIDIHEGWLKGHQHPVVRRTYKIRHYYPSEPITIQGESAEI